jgi:hypothetical protein
MQEYTQYNVAYQNSGGKNNKVRKVEKVKASTLISSTFE